VSERPGEQVGDPDPLSGVGSETLWDKAPRRTMRLVVKRGWLKASEAARLFEEYKDKSSRVSFSSFLLERQLVSMDQISEIEKASGAADAPRREIARGAVFSGCEIVKKLGEGGMGVVYLATRTSDDAQVVVKFLAAEHVRNRSWRARFLREAMVARKIDHPNVVKVYDVEVEGNQPHIVMELVSGTDLEEQLEEGPLPAQEVARIGRDIARGLAAAHAQGVIHRDVKPGNVRLSSEGVVKILDFGLAKAVETDDGVSLAGQILGTPYYMAPEQWGDHMVDPRTDVFALGATLYHLVTGQPPYPGKKPMSIYRRALEGKCAIPSDLEEGISPQLDLAILRMLAVDRRARFATAHECAKALQATLEGAPVSVPSLTEVASGKRFPLVPCPIYVLGRGEEADIQLSDHAASRTHARISFTSTGYQLVDLESSYGTYVNDMRVNDVLLKTGDLVRCGKLKLRFDDGGVGAKTLKRLSKKLIAGEIETQPQVTTLPEPFLDYLVKAKDKRTVIALVERLPMESIAARVDSCRTFLRKLYGGDLAEEATRALRDKLVGRRRSAARHLFQITFENLQEECEDWLTWWTENSEAYPAQIGPQRLHPRVRLRVVSGCEPQVLELTDRLTTTVGRGDENDIDLDNRSLSRRHATVLRLHQRLMIRDDGSRFGTRVAGKPVASAFISHGDEVSLGQVNLTCDVEDLVANPPKTAQGLYLVDPKLFGVLCDLRHVSVAAALFGFVRFTRDLEWVGRQAARLLGPSAEVQACAKTVRNAYYHNLDRAKKLLPTLVPSLASLPSDDGGVAWGKALGEADLGPQLLPVGWFQASA
jgi:serine/threonine protein kinase